MRRRKAKRDKPDYDEPVKPPEGAELETVLRALLDAPPPGRDHATSDEPKSDEK
jgi:hypothetical protein